MPLVDDFDLFMENIYNYTKIDLRKYKRPQMQRRLTALRDKRGYPDFATYFQALKKEDALFSEFLDRMTINVSEFFRNPNRWDVVRDRVLPELLKQKKRVKVWSAACSTGEEPYTLVMLLNQLLPYAEIQVLATDLDESVIARAKQGLYSERSLHFVPDDFKRKYFTDAGNHLFAISDAVKRCVTFKKHNLLEDKFESDFDLIVCRNVIIYFTEDAKDKLYQKFSDALRPGGVLFVGSTEQIFNPQTFQFSTYDTFFYQRQ